MDFANVDKRLLSLAGATKALHDLSYRLVVAKLPKRVQRELARG